MRARTALVWAVSTTLGLLAFAGEAAGHEMRPSHVALVERPDRRLEVTFRVATSGDGPGHLRLVLPPRCTPVGPETVEDAPRTVVRHALVDCGPSGLDALTVRVDGLHETGTEVVLTAGGTTRLLRGDAPSITLPGSAREPAAAIGRGGWLRLGVEHILAGPDHLAFVAGLFLLVGSGFGAAQHGNRRSRARRLLGTLTAFTLAHSVTLALAALGVVSPARGAVEAIIALSILVLARELARENGEDAAPTWARRAPWAFALVCGLLHGFGFAGALGDLGLPASDRLAALVLFNLGVELGQLAFVVTLEGLRRAGRAALTPWPRAIAASRHGVVYTLGAVASFWCLGRSFTILT